LNGLIETRNKTFLVTEPTTLLPFLLSRLPEKGRNKVKGLLTHHQVIVEGQTVTRHDHALLPGQQVIIQSATASNRDALYGVKILFEDAHIIVIDKPPGLLSIATEKETERTAYRTLMDHVRNEHKEGRVFIVHRLDRDTSGVMMFAKSEKVQQALQNSWRESVLERLYIAVVEGHVKPESGTIKAWLKESKTQTMYVSGKPGDGIMSVTHYKVLQANNMFSLLEVKLDTGRKNQIRVHMQNVGHSVVGDKRYGSKRDPLHRLGLHAQVLSFCHPVTGEVLRYATNIPASFQSLFLPTRENE
jgi:23S rRNA pseudouridine1911/1915/1917 synthase